MSWWIAWKTSGNSTRIAAKFIDIEKPAVVDLFPGDSPEGEAIGLRLNQSVQQIKALRLAHRAVKLSQGRVNGASHLRIWSEEARQCAV